MYLTVFHNAIGQFFSRFLIYATITKNETK